MDKQAPTGEPNVGASPGEVQAIANSRIETEANRKRRLAYFGVRPGTLGHGTPDIFKDDAKPPIFHFYHLTATESQDFADLFFVDYRIARDKMDAAARWILDRKLKGWDDYTTRPSKSYPNGEAIPFERTQDGKALSDDCWASISIPLRTDLMNLILGANMADEEETAGVKS